MPANNEKFAIRLQAMSRAEEIYVAPVPWWPSEQFRLVCGGMGTCVDRVWIPDVGISEVLVHRGFGLGEATPTPVEDLAGRQQADMNRDVRELDEVSPFAVDLRLRILLCLGR